MVLAFGFIHFKMRGCEMDSFSEVWRMPPFYLALLASADLSDLSGRDKRGESQCLLEGGDAGHLEGPWVKQAQEWKLRGECFL